MARSAMGVLVVLPIAVIGNNQWVSPCGRQAWMADVLDDLDDVESEMPDFTRFALDRLPDASVSQAFVVLDRALAHPAQDQQEQAN
jgi:hypothetical protein